MYVCSHNNNRNGWFNTRNGALAYDMELFGLQNIFCASEMALSRSHVQHIVNGYMQTQNLLCINNNILLSSYTLSLFFHLELHHTFASGTSVFVVLFVKLIPKKNFWIMFARCKTWIMHVNRVVCELCARCSVFFTSSPMAFLPDSPSIFI